MLKQLRSIRFLSLSGILIILISSCGTTKQSSYFVDVDAEEVRPYKISPFNEPLIQVDDILSITVQTIDPKASSIANQTGSAMPSVAEPGAGPNNYLVDKNGDVEIPMLGMIKLSGLTTTAAKELVKVKAAEIWYNPTVQLRFSNYKISVLGEVSRPASYTLPNERVTVLDALSLAGDITVYGKKQNVMLIRNNGDQQEIVRLDLTSSSLMSSPYFYLKQNDVLFVDATKAKSAANNAPRNQMITIALAIATLLVTAIGRF